jgi:hypothetical protein
LSVSYRKVWGVLLLGVLHAKRLKAHKNKRQKKEKFLDPIMGGLREDGSLKCPAPVLMP